MPRRFSGLASPIHRLTPRLAGLSGADTGFVRRDGRSASHRGYGRDWQKVRLQVLRATPLCAFCGEQGRVTVATDVDHIEPFSGVADPRRLDVSNLRPLCSPCHRRRTARQANGQEG
jgi:5-methylcytosine-specific restriction protein A